MFPQNCPFTPFIVTRLAEKKIQNAWSFVIIQLTDIHGGEFDTIINLVAGRLRFISLTQKTIDNELIRAARHLETIHPKTECMFPKAA